MKKHQASQLVCESFHRTPCTHDQLSTMKYRNNKQWKQHHENKRCITNILSTLFISMYLFHLSLLSSYCARPHTTEQVRSDITISTKKFRPSQMSMLFCGGERQRLPLCDAWRNGEIIRRKRRRRTGGELENIYTPRYGSTGNGLVQVRVWFHLQKEWIRCEITWCVSLCLRRVHISIFILKNNFKIYFDKILYQTQLVF
jgi:hypothetical protein